MTVRQCRLLATLVALTLALPASAGTLRVPEDHATLLGALAAAGSGDAVEIACGTWFESGLSIPSGVELRSATGDPGCVTLDSAGLTSVLTCENVTGVRISGLTLSNGNTSSFGGGLFVADSAVEVSGCRIVNNFASLGGGVFSTRSTLKLVGCEVSDNTANEESGVMCLGGTASFTDCTIARNGTSIGGGMGLFSTSATLTRVHVLDNVSWETGGGVEVWTGSTATFIDCLIEGNSAAWGGGVYIHDRAGPVEFRGTTITGNVASDEGGGVLVGWASSLLAVDSTILDNEGPNGADAYVTSTAAVILSCCEVDLARWLVDGMLTVDDTGCTVRTVPSSWARLKAHFGR
jgi:hypothetical protein